MQKSKKGINSLKLILLYIIIVLASFLILFFTLKETISSGERSKTLTEEATNRIGLKQLNIFDISLYGKSPNNDKTEIFYIRARKDPSSQDIRLNQILITLQLQDTDLTSYTYSEIINCSINNNNTANLSNSLYNDSNANYFGVKYLINNSHIQNSELITRFDIVEFCFKSPRQIQNSEKIFLTLTPKDGKTFTLEKDLPETFMMDKNVIYQEGIEV